MTTNSDPSVDPHDEVWLGEDLEQAYQQALQTVQAAEIEATDDSHSPDAAAPTDAETDAGETVETKSSPTDDPQNASASRGESSAEAEGESAGSAGPPVTPKQVIEAALFVGGIPLTIKKLRSLLTGVDQDFVESTIDELNRQYTDENRPYEIQFGEGGYRMVLKPNFERVRNRAFGLGPKEVKLSQDALEVLALVAYRQPISAPQIEECGKKKPASLLRQLLRRQLIAIQRGEDRRQDVLYCTTPRFLELFGLGHIDELPQVEELSFK